MAKEINVIGHKIEIGAGSSTGHPDFKGQQTSDIRSWIRIDGGEWYKIAHGFNTLQILELFEYCKRESQVFAIFEMLGDVLRVKAKPPLNESVLPISDVSGSSSNEPENCTKDYNENTCDGCEFRNYELVGHPGGGCDNRVSVEKAWCELGYWKDDF